MASLLEVQHLSKSFPIRSGLLGLKRTDLVAVKNVSFAVETGETFGIVGESGSGKSTIGKMIVGIYRATSGKIRYRGTEITPRTLNRSSRLRRDIQMIFQDIGASLNPRRTIKQILETPFAIHGMRKECPDAIKELLERVDLPSAYLTKRPGSLSGGQRQRVSIARVLAVEPKVLVLDEPTSALDVSVQGKIIELLAALQRDVDIGYIFITHDLSLMRHVATRTGVMYFSEFFEMAPTERLFAQPMHPYTRTLLAAVPVIYDEEEAAKPADESSGGEIPSLVNRPTGCTFHDRCIKKIDGICDREIPELVELTDNHWVACHWAQQEYAGSPDIAEGEVQ